MYRADWMYARAWGLLKGFGDVVSRVIVEVICPLSAAVLAISLYLYISY